MPILKYEELTASDLAALPRGRTAVFMNVGPLENHGPHLPLGNDPIQSTTFGRMLAQRLEKTFPDWNFLFLPPIHAGCDTMMNRGSIEIRPATLRRLVYEHACQLSKDGFRTIVALSAHAGPRHLVVLEEVAERMRWRRRTRMISVSSRMLLEVLRGGFVDRIASRLEARGERLSDAERAGLRHDYHGGLLETSITLHLRPDLVKPSYRELRPAIIEKIWKINRGSGASAGDGLGYLGTPALARAPIGEAAISAIFDGVTPLLERFLAGEDVRRHFRSKFYYIPIFRTDFRAAIFLFIYVLAFAGAWILAVRFMTEVLR
ncbi:MAG: creatininase family protein [Deltaproteobacteria bacterium]|nr:creatininase family protein [Deltaproteobacteria bacterium]